MPQLLKAQILQMNRDRSREFIKTITLRRKYRKKHPTEFAATMCMDGRVNLARALGLPFGIIYPLRNIGGNYEVGWPMLGYTLNQWEAYAYSQRRPAVLFITYHWSDTDKHLGCRGFNYDREKAIAKMTKFRDDISWCYSNRIWPVMVGIETDSDGLIVHGSSGKVLDLRTIPVEKTGTWLIEKIDQLFPDFPQQVKADMLPLFINNINNWHARKVSGTSKVLVHNERVLAIGQGFDWLQNDNFALIIGPCDPDLDHAIVTAASILQNNLEEGRIPNKGVLLISTPYRQQSERNLAILQSRHQTNFALEAIKRDLPDMANFFDPLVTVINLDDRLLEVCN